MESKRLDICLATYNGMPWIKEFLSSLDAQTYENWRLIVSDDDSCDGTVEQIRAHFVHSPGKLVVVQRDSTGLGVIRNFQDAIDASNAEYVLLADQDDVWQPNKLERLYQTMRRIEAEQRSMPALVFSDLEVVDEQLQLLDASWWSFSSTSPAWANSFRGMLCQNVVPGCAMMLNRILIDLALPFPPKILMHDWWLLLVCTAFGKVGSCRDSLVRYRRHADAHTYLEQEALVSKLSRCLSGGYAGRRMMKNVYGKTVLQAKSFVNAYGDRLEALQGGWSMRQALDAYIMSSEKGWWQRRWILMQGHFKMASLFQTVKFYLYI